MSRAKAMAASRQLRVAAASIAAVALVASGWAAEKVYETVNETVNKQHHATKTIVNQPLPSLDGKGVWNTQIVFGTMANDPETAEAVLQQHHETVKRLIAEKKYAFESTFEIPEGVPQYQYRFELPDGTEFITNFALRLEQVSSWEDYLQRVKEQNLRRHQQIKTAVSLGQFRLLDVDFIRTHLCRERDSGQKVDVQCIVSPDGTEKALVSIHPAHEAQKRHETEWHDHLAAIRRGERELLDVGIVRDYKYEVTLADGSKTTFSYGGNSALTRPAR